MSTAPSPQSGRRAGLACVVGLMALAGASLARAAMPADLSGVWLYDRDRAALDRSTPPVTPKVAALLEKKRQARLEGYVRAVQNLKCLPSGVPQMMAWISPIYIFQDYNRVAIISEDDPGNDQPRTVYLGQKAHPPVETIFPSWNGHSIGHWEGDTLLVDTVGLNGRNQNISEKMHITERIYLDKKTGDLVDEMVLDDPDIYAQPYHITNRYRRAVGQEANELQEYACEVDPNNLFAYLAEQKAAGHETEFNPAWTASNYNDPASVAASEAKTK